MAGTIENLKRIWQATGLLQRVIIVTVLLALAAAGWVLFNWAGKPEMTLLYSNISREEAAKIVEKINDAGVPYELTDGGTTIKAPVDQVHSLRLKMASAGLPSGGRGGYEILDKEKIGASPFTQRVNYIRAVEGELAKSIELMEGVTQVRVHVVRPQSDIFAGAEQNASATVVVRIRPGWRLSPSNVAAIVNMVAGSVEGLSTEKVVVVDSGGRLLAGGDGQNEIASKAGTFLDYKSQVEQYLSEKAEQMLAAALGPGRASVKVNAVVDITNQEESTETYSPDNKVTVKEEIQSSSSTPGGSEKTAGGSTREETITNEYMVSKTIKRVTDLPGEITSLSVAAMVDLSATKSEGEGGEEKNAQKIMAVTDVEEIIRNALGLQDSDKLKVVETTFQKSAVAELPAQESGGLFSSDFLLQLAERFSLGILVIGALILLRMLRGAKSKVAAGEQSSASALEAGAAGRMLPGAAEQNPEMLRVRISQALQDNPDEVKRLFRKWAEPEYRG